MHYKLTFSEAKKEKKKKREIPRIISFTKLMHNNGPAKFRTNGHIDGLNSIVLLKRKKDSTHHLKDILCASSWILDIIFIFMLGKLKT